MFPMVLPLPRTSASFCAGVVCFFAHTGSASMAMGLRLGGVPAKVTVPVIDEPAPAAPGPIDIATSAVASHNFLPVQRIIIYGSLVIAKPATWSVDAALHLECADCTPGQSSVQPVPNLRNRSGSDLSTQTFSKASDSASFGSRSGTSACRRNSQLAAATKQPPTAANAATS